MIVYRLTNRLNGMSYVGITTRGLPARLAQHFAEARKSNPRYRLHRAIQKYGVDAFDISVIEEAPDLASLQAAEERLIREIGTLSPSGYNLNSGGRLALPSDETRSRMSAAKQGWSPSPELRAIVSRARTGFKHTDEVKAKIGASHKGRKHTPEAIARMKAGRVGFRLPESAKESLRRKIIAGGLEYASLGYAAKAMGVSITTISRRAERGVEGYSVIGKVRPRRQRTSEQVEAMRSRSSTPVLADGQEFPSMEAAAIALNMTRPGVAYRIKIGRPGYSLL